MTSKCKRCLFLDVDAGHWPCCECSNIVDINKVKDHHKPESRHVLIENEKEQERACIIEEMKNIKKDCL